MTIECYHQCSNLHVARVRCTVCEAVVAEARGDITDLVVIAPLYCQRCHDKDVDKAIYRQPKE